MEFEFSEESYEEMLSELFVRFPSFQKSGVSAYKPGIGNMEHADMLLGHPHSGYRIIHVAGTNGKGSVSNMLASCLAAAGLRVGLYTSPHILDFRERIRLVTSSFGQGNAAVSEMIPKKDVWSFVLQWREMFDRLDLSFFEITTLMALDWFSCRCADVVVLETGLGGRLDSTNIVTPVLSVITNVGLDHCDLLGGTLPEIAFEKAGIIKQGVPVVIGESDPETDRIFERKVMYVNSSRSELMAGRNPLQDFLTYADKVSPSLWEIHQDILQEMDLKGEYQRKNLRTVLATMDVLMSGNLMYSPQNPAFILPRAEMKDALVHAAERTGFRGRWEKISDDPYVICDIGHNEHGLKYNFAQLSGIMKKGVFTHLIMVYGSVADKDVDSVLHIFPSADVCIFTQAQGKRALSAEKICDKFLDFCRRTGRHEGKVKCAATVSEAVSMAYAIASDLKMKDASSRPYIYIGGSTYVVSEAIAAAEANAGS